MNIGILGGTFDPIHAGHLTIAEEARLKLGLNLVLFVPAGRPWLKADRDITSPVHRVEMIKRAIAPNPYFKLSTAEIDRPGPSYTVDTIAVLQEQLGASARLHLLLGWDSLAELPRWKEPTRVLRLSRLVAIPRPGFSSPGSEVLEDLIPGITGSVIFLDMPPVDISSSDIRTRVAKGLSIHGLVTDEVESYIEEQNLYC